MRILRECLFIFLALLILPIEGTSQSLNATGNQWIGKTHSQQRQSRNNLFHLQQAQVLTRKFDWEESYFALENAVSENPSSPNALLRRAQFKALIGMGTEAQADLELAKRLHPYAVDLYGANTLGEIRKIMNYEPLRSIEKLDFDYRIEYYYDLLDQLLLKEDEQSEAINILYQAIDSLRLQNLAEAKKLVKKIIRKFPSLPYGYDLKGLIHLEMGEFRLAKTALTEAVSLDEQYAFAWYNLARAEEALGNLNNAATFFLRTTLLKPALSKAYFDRALVLKKMGDWIGAIQNYNAVIELKGKDHLEALLNRGLTYKQMGELRNAMMDINTAIALSPNNAGLYKNRGNIHLLNGQYRHATEAYTKAIELDNEIKEAWYNRGLTHVIQLDNVSACYDFQKSKKLGYKVPEEISSYSCSE